MSQEVNRDIMKKIVTLILLSCMLSLTACSQSHSTSGYIEGEYTYIASGVSGTLFQLGVERGQPIEIGDFLYQLDPNPEKSTLDNAAHHIQNLNAQLIYAKQQLERIRKLREKQFASAADFDLAQSNFDAQAAGLMAAQSSYQQMQWAVKEKRKLSPLSGMVFDTFFRVGEKVQANQPVLALLSAEHIKVLFYVPEEALSQLKIGDVISFDCDHCQKNLTAKIEFISKEAQYTPPVLYSKGSREKLVYLVRAKIPEKIALQFHPGQPVDVFWTGA